MIVDPQDELACARLLVSASYFADFHRVEEFVALFTPGGSVERKGEPFVGLDAIRAFMAGRDRGRRTRHVLSPPLIEFDGADSARGLALFTLFDGEGGDDAAALPVAMPATVGEFRQTYRRVDGVWRIVSHHAAAAFRRI